MAKCVGSERSSSYAGAVIEISSTQSAWPHSQTRTSSPVSGSKVRLTSSIRSFSSRKTASFRPIRRCRSSIAPTLLGGGRSLVVANRASFVQGVDDLAGTTDLLHDRVAVSSLHDDSGSHRSSLVARNVREMAGVRSNLLVLLEAESNDPRAAWIGAFADERDGRLDAIGARRGADALVRLSKGCVVRCDPFLLHSLHVFLPPRRLCAGSCPRGTGRNLSGSVHVRRATALQQVRVLNDDHPPAKLDDSPSLEVAQDPVCRRPRGSSQFGHLLL